MSNTEKKESLVILSFIFQLLIGILLLIFSSLDISSSDSVFFLNYSLEKTILLGIHLFCVFFLLGIAIISKWRIPFKIQNLLITLAKNRFAFSSIFIIILSVLFGMLWIHNYGNRLSFWFIYQKFSFLLLWGSLIVINILIIGIRLLKDSLLDSSCSSFKHFFDKQKFKVLFVWIIGVAFFLFIGNAEFIINKEFIYTKSSPFTLQLGALFSLIIVIYSCIYDYIYNYDKNFQNQNYFLTNSFIIIFVILFGHGLRFSEQFFNNWKSIEAFLNYRVLIYLGFFIAIGMLIWMFYQDFIFNKVKFNLKKLTTLKYFSLGSISFLLIYISLIKFGDFVKISDDRFWNGAGNPVNFSLILISFSFVLLFLIIYQLLTYKKRKVSPFIFSCLMIIGVVILAVIVWQWNPDFNNFFVIKPSAPNFELYPNSDAQGIDLGGQFLRYGQGINNNRRTDQPFVMFSTFVYHLFAKQDYEQVYQFQMVVMLFLPIGIFLLGKKLGSPEIGMFAAALIVFQENEAILLSGVISNVHIQLLMSEILTFLFVVWACYFFIRIIKTDSTWLDIAISGVVLGIASLCRLNSVFIFIAFSLILFLQVLCKKQIWIKLFQFFSWFSVIFFGWYTYLFFITGSFYFWDKIKQVLIRTNSFVLPTGKQAMLASTSLSLFIAEKINILYALFNHFLHNIFTSFIVLPLNFSTSIPTNINNLDFVFWDSYNPWNGELTSLQWMMILFNFSILTIGLWNLWKKNKWAAFVPLIAFFAYILSLGFARTSGGRYLTPINWVLVFYYASGWWVVFQSIFPFLKKNIIPANLFDKTKFAKFGRVFVFSLLILCFFSMMGLPFIIPDQPVLTQNELISFMEVAYLQNGRLLDNLESNLNTKDLLLTEAIVFFPSITNQKVLNCKIIHNDLRNFSFAVKNDASIILPHDTHIIFFGYDLGKRDVTVVEYAFLDENDDWQLFDADLDRIFEIVEK